MASVPAPQSGKTQPQTAQEHISLARTARFHALRAGAIALSSVGICAYALAQFATFLIAPILFPLWIIPIIPVYAIVHLGVQLGVGCSFGYVALTKGWNSVMHFANKHLEEADNHYAEAEALKT